MRRLAQAIGRFAGLDPPPWLLEARVRERAEELGLDEDGYLDHIERDEAETERLVERLRVGETRFFRHRAQIEALRKHVLPSLIDARPLRAWSAGCSTGEEAFTLALLLEEAAPRGDWEVMGTDLSASALAAAETGRFPRARLDEIPLRYRQHFSIESETIVARPALRRRVRFSRANLVDALHPRGVDLVLCRNVLIYFDAERRAQVIARLGEALRPSGWLCLGYSEALRGGEEARLEPVRVEDSVLYRRREITARIELPPTVEQPVHEPDRPHPPERPHAHLVKLRGEYHDGARLAAELRPFLAGPAVVDLDGAHFLGDEAARVLSRALQAAPTLKLRATRVPITRWLAKHGLVPK